MLDLQQFCGAEDDAREWLRLPFAIGKYTYCTNGHIMIRVPFEKYLSAELENANIKVSGERIENFFLNSHAPTLQISGELPEKTYISCMACKGSGKTTEPAHDECPCCTCDEEEVKCYACEGTGKTSSDKGITVSVCDTPFDIKYIRLILSLPDLKIQNPILEERLFFTFDGGEGFLMPLTGNGVININMETKEIEDRYAIGSGKV